jgi:ribosomal-protein-alanine N-acetyltransferase
VFNIILREAREEDLNVIYAIESSVYSVPWTLNFFRIILHMKKNMFIVATRDRQILGYTIGEIETRRVSKDTKKIGHIMNIAVSNEYQGKGVGTILLDEIENIFIEQKAAVSYLEVRESNKRAQQIYKKRGYYYLKTVQKYYGDENGLIMSKKLTR